MTAITLKFDKVLVVVGLVGFGVGFGGQPGGNGVELGVFGDGESFFFRFRVLV